jgi:hypothetical protein
MKKQTIIIVAILLALAFGAGILVGRKDYKKQVDKANFYYTMAEDCV